MNAPRLDIMPLLASTPAAGTSAVVYGGVLRLLSFGPPPAPAAGPVQVVFSVRYFERARSTPQEIAAFAQLQGTLLATDVGFRLAFRQPEEPTVKARMEIRGQVHPKAGTLPPLSLHLGFGPGVDFSGSAELVQPKGQSKAATPFVRIELPGSEKPARYLELLVELQRDGEILAPRASNGVLDIALAGLDFVVCFAKDSNGKVIVNAPVEVTLSDGSVAQGSTDPDGRFALNGVPPGECSVVFKDRDNLELPDET